NRGRESGYIGLEELKKLQELRRRGLVEIIFAGEEVRPDQIAVAKNVYVDAQIRALAEREEAILLTSDHVQAEVARAMGLPVIYYAPTEKIREPPFVRYFEEGVASVHLKEGVPPKRKRWVNGEYILEELDEKPLSRAEMKRMAKDIVELAKRDPKSYIEIEADGATVVQFREYRIAIAYPPFADGWEITIVRPVAKVSLDDYKLSDKLLERLEKRAEGILIAGPPGAGKSTFATALAEFYRSKGKIVKTMESPRDLQVPDDITQYAPLEGDMEKTADILLLVRPDYTIYDEVRKTRDFEIFADMRLAGVGMIGVTHASRPVEAVQRFVRRIELGIVPQVVDTIIFINKGRVEKVLTLGLTVKVPTGMTEADLARPVVEVRDFATGKLEYEIYTYGEETVVVPIKEEKESPLEEHAKRSIQVELSRYIPFPFRIEVRKNKVILYVAPENVPHVIGKKGKNIAELEEIIGMPIEVKEEKAMPKISVRRKRIVIKAGKKGKAEVYVDGELVYEGNTDAKGVLKIPRGSPGAEEIERALKEGRSIEVKVK
ncbi:MAG: Flp pilus assembly complex ATPase component, partial [Candidatus Diapherotrites archaeon]|nr:Flp pilus assembly complex ATPase component [Candidatus Diapherotrites archaeon]